MDTRDYDNSKAELSSMGESSIGSPVQPALFESMPSAIESVQGYRSPVACTIAGITYRQLDYWARTGLVEPTVRDVTGSGNQRLYSFRDMLLLKVVKRLLDAGVSLQNIRSAVTYLQNRSAESLTDITLMSDGVSVYECTSNEELIDLVRQGQGVFGIAVGQVWRELAGSLSALPVAEELVVENSDELAARRTRRIS